MYTESETEPIKGSSSAFPSAPPSQHPDGHFNYPPTPPATMTTGIPVMNYQPHHSPIQWASGLCDCFDDPASCCLTCWCPCIAFGRIAEIVDRGTITCGLSGTLYGVILGLTGLSCIYSCFYRSKLRGQYFLEESPCTDCCVHCCFEECALCQEYRELKNRGFDMSKGWQGNMERWNRGVPLPPMVQRPMTQ